MLAGCCDPYNDKALRASRAAPFHFPIASGGWAQLQAVLERHKMACLAAQPHATGIPWRLGRGLGLLKVESCKLNSLCLDCVIICALHGVCTFKKDLSCRPGLAEVPRCSALPQPGCCHTATCHPNAACIPQLLVGGAYAI